VRRPNTNQETPYLFQGTEDYSPKTATIGDPSGQSSERRRFAHEEVFELANSYTEL